MNKTTKFSIDNFQDYLEDDNFEMAEARVMFLSTRPNCYGFNISEEVLKKYAPTIRGKWVTTEFDGVDFKTHTDKQNIIGRVSEKAVIDFEYDSDGYLCAWTDVIISKLYATNEYEALKNNNYRAVSIEMIDNEDDDKNITEFNICTITVLGLNYKPAIKGANIQLTKFSQEIEDYYENKIIKFSKDDKLESKINNLETKIDLIVDKLNNGNGGNKEMENKDTEVLELELEQEQVEVETENKDVEVEVEPEKTICVEELEERIAQLEKEISKKNEIISQLEDFKTKTLEEQKSNIVNQTLAKLKEDLTNEKFDEFKESSKTYTLENINVWENEVKAFAFDNPIKAKKNVEDDKPQRMSEDLFDKTEIDNSDPYAKYLNK